MGFVGTVGNIGGLVVAHTEQAVVVGGADVSWSWERRPSCTVPHCQKIKQTVADA